MTEPKPSRQYQEALMKVRNIAVEVLRAISSVIGVLGRSDLRYRLIPAYACGVAIQAALKGTQPGVSLRQLSHNELPSAR